MFLNVKAQYWSCMGETVLKKTQYNEDTAKARHQYRTDQDALIAALRGSQRAESQVAQQTQFQQLLATVLRPVIQNIVIPVIRAFQAATAFVRNLFQAPVAQQLANAATAMAAATGKFLQQAASQILTFFFGHKKENDKTDDKKQRERNDAAATDLFGKTIFNDNNVEGAQGKFLGG